jgi:hypothetical protein
MFLGLGILTILKILFGKVVIRYTEKYIQIIYKIPFIEYTKSKWNKEVIKNIIIEDNDGKRKLYLSTHYSKHLLVNSGRNLES